MLKSAIKNRDLKKNRDFTVGFQKSRICSLKTHTYNKRAQKS